MSTSNVLSSLPTETRDNPEAQAARITSAYRALFSGNGGQEDADLVLVDLAKFVRYYDTASLTADPQTVVAAAHRQAVLKLILVGRGGEPQGFMEAVLTAPDPYVEETDN